MSSHKVLVSKILKVEHHPQADRLDLVQVEGWSCVTGRGAFKPGDLCVYIPIDSVLSPATEAVLFPPDSKIKLSKSRVKTAKIRGCVSQGMAVQPNVLALLNVRVGDDVTAKLGITKYEPPVKVSTCSGPKRKLTAKAHPGFHKYTDLENIKNYTTVFADGEQVLVTEKIHGTNFRCGWLPFVARSWWHKVRGWFGANPHYEFVFGSRNVQLQDRPREKTFYTDNVYLSTVNKYKLRTKVPMGMVIYGEIYGPDIQKGYHYGTAAGHSQLAIFDVWRDGKYLAADLARFTLERMGLGELAVPLLYVGPFSMDRIRELTSGDSVLAPSQRVREGVVVRPLQEEVSHCGRKLLKSISSEFLLSKHADDEVAHDQVS